MGRGTMLLMLLLLQLGQRATPSVGAGLLEWRCYSLVHSPAHNLHTAPLMHTCNRLAGGGVRLHGGLQRLGTQSVVGACSAAVCAWATRR